MLCYESFMNHPKNSDEIYLQTLEDPYKKIEKLYFLFKNLIHFVLFKNLILTTIKSMKTKVYNNMNLHN